MLEGDGGGVIEYQAKELGGQSQDAVAVAKNVVRERGNSRYIFRSDTSQPPQL